MLFAHDSLNVQIDEWNFLFFEPAENFDLPDGGGVTIRATDFPGGLPTDLEFIVTLISVNDPPLVVSQIENITIDEDPEGGRVNIGDLDEMFNDPDGDTLEFSFRGAPDELNMELNQWNFLFFEPDENFNLPEGVDITVTAEDAMGDTTEMVFNIVIEPVNDAPTSFRLVSPRNNSSIDRDEYSVDFSWQESQDVDGDEILYTLYLDLEYGGVDTLLMFSDIAETEFTVEVDTSLIDLGLFIYREDVLEVVWWVEASDGVENVASDDTWTLTVPVPLSVRDWQELIPMEYSLSQNYPNPFNPVTKIEIGLPRAGEISLQVWDMRGRLVGTAAAGQFTAGYHTIEWQAKDMPGGVYIFMLRAGSEKLVRKGVLLK